MLRLAGQVPKLFHMSNRAPSRWLYLDRKPGSAYRQLFIKGRNIAARILYGSYVSEQEAQTPEQIAADFQIPLESVLEAIAYCESDPPEIQQDWEMEEASIRARGMNGSNSTGSTNSQAPLLAE